MPTINLDIQLPGSLTLERGTARDYRALARFHYRAVRPATFAGVWTVRWRPGAFGSSDRPVAVAVLSWPTLRLAIRERVLGLAGMNEADRRQWVNLNIRTISRLIVHPTFRSLGFARRLVEQVLTDCDTRYVEAVAMMGRAHPVFRLAGMRQYDPGSGPIYYLHDRMEPAKRGNSPADAGPNR